MHSTNFNNKYLQIEIAFVFKTSHLIKADELNILQKLKFHRKIIVLGSNPV